MEWLDNHQEERVPQPVFLLMPEWQGSSSSRAMQLAEGAALLREDLPQSALREVPVPLEAGDAMGTPVARLSSVLQARDAARRTLSEVADNVPLIVGGDCATSLAGLEAARNRFGDDLAVLWFDAHPDLQHPSTSPSGSASGMTLRHALGDGSPDLTAQYAITASQLTLIGTRVFDPEEELELERRGITVLGATPYEIPEAFGASEASEASEVAETPGAPETPEAPEAPEQLAERLTAILKDSGATRVYIHVDLDVLDPAEFSSVHAPVPFGLTLAQLTSAIRAAVAACPLAGASICEFAPADPSMAAEDLPSVLRILGALTSGDRA